MAGDRSRGDASRRDSESPRREGRRRTDSVRSWGVCSDRLNPSTRTREARKPRNREIDESAPRSPVRWLHSSVSGASFRGRSIARADIRDPAHPRRMAAGFAESPGLELVFLRVAHVLGLGGLDNSSGSEGATVHSLGASAPGPGDTSREAFSSPVGATGASRGRALLSPRLGLGTGKSRCRLGTSWGLRLQAMNCRRCAAGEKSLDIAECDLVGGDEANGIIRARTCAASPRRSGRALMAKLKQPLAGE